MIEQELEVLGRIAEYVKDYRAKNNNMTKVELATMMKLSQTHVSRIEAGDQNLSLKILLAIARLEHNSLAQFLTYLEDKSSDNPNISLPPSSVEDSLYRRFKRVPEDDLKLFLKHVENNKNNDTKIIPDKLRWGVQILNRIFRGNKNHWIEFEIFTLNLYLNRIEEKDKEAVDRLNRLLKHRFKV